MPEQYRGHPVAPVEEAARLRRAQVRDNPACLPGLAAALTDLGRPLPRGRPPAPGQASSKLQPGPRPP